MSWMRRFYFLIKKFVRCGDIERCFAVDTGSGGDGDLLFHWIVVRCIRVCVIQFCVCPFCFPYSFYCILLSNFVTILIS